MPEPIDLTRLPDGPADGAVIARLDGLAPDHAATCSVAGLPLFIQPWGSTVLAYVNRCPHLGVPLDLMPGRMFHPQLCQFVCSTHGARFAPETGLCTTGPCAGLYLQAVAVSRDGDSVRARRC